MLILFRACNREFKTKDQRPHEGTMIEFKDMLSEIEGFPDQQRLEVFRQSRA